MKWFQIQRARNKQGTQDSQEVKLDLSGATTRQKAEEQTALTKEAEEPPLLTAQQKQSERVLPPKPRNPVSTVQPSERNAEGASLLKASKPKQLNSTDKQSRKLLIQHRASKSSSNLQLEEENKAQPPSNARTLQHSQSDAGAPRKVLKPGPLL